MISTRLLAFSLLLASLTFSVSASIILTYADDRCQLDYYNDDDYLHYIVDITIIDPSTVPSAAWDEALLNNNTGPLRSYDDPLRKSIILTMQNTNEPFMFMGQLDLRCNVILRDKAIDTLKDMNSKVWYNYGKGNYRTENPNWGPVHDRSIPPINLPLFGQLYNHLASADIKSLCTDMKTTYGECYGALIACVWWGSDQAFEPYFDMNNAPGSLNMGVFMQNGGLGWKYAATDMTTYVPGDWLYMQNYDYEEVLAHFGVPGGGGAGRPALVDKAKCLCSGENCLCLKNDNGLRIGGLGGDHYADVSVDTMREGLRRGYNSDLKAVIDYRVPRYLNSAGGIALVHVISKPEARDVIKIVGVARITNNGPYEDLPLHGR